MTALNFNARSVQPSTGIADPIPAGWYNTMIDESEVKATGDGQGKFLSLRFNILDGQYVNRKVFARLNIQNNNAQAQEIAYKDLSAICHAVNVFDLQDSQQLHGIPMKIKVSLRPAKAKLDGNGNPTGEMYEPSNDVKAYRNINEQVDMPTATAPQGAAPGNFAQQPQQPAAPQGWGAPAQAPQQPQGGQPWQQPQGQQPQQGAPQYAPPPAQYAPPQQPQQQPQQQFAPAPQGYAPPPQQFAPAAPMAPAPGAAASQPWMQGGQQPQGGQPQQTFAPPAQQPQGGAPTPPWQRPAA